MSSTATPAPTERLYLNMIARVDGGPWSVVLSIALASNIEVFDGMFVEEQAVATH